MKRFLLLVAMLMCIGNLSAQTKIAYCDVYLRGGWNSLTATVMYDSTTFDLGEYMGSNIGEVLNYMAADGWVLDREIVIPRHPLYSLFTRHKLHLIMKKEYQPGENPFSLFEYSVNNNYNSNRIESTTPVPSVVEVEYNGVKAIKVVTYEDMVVLASINGKNGTWNEAMEYCKSLGDGWRLPSTEEFNLIKNKLTDNAYWTCEETNEKFAKCFYWSYNCSYTKNKNASFYIQPIAIVRAEDLK